MNINSLADLNTFEKDVAKIQEAQYLVLINANKDSIKVSTKTALLNLPKLFDQVIRIGNTKGFHATSLRDLSKATDMSLGKIYTYINNKQDLLLMLHSHYISLIERVYEEIGLPFESQKDNLLLTIKTHLYLSELYRPWFYFAYTESKHLQQKFITLSKKSELKSDLYIRDIVEQGITAKEFRIVDASFTSSMVKALLQDWYLKPWKYQNRKFNVDKYYHEVASLLDIYLNPAE